MLNKYIKKSTYLILILTILATSAFAFPKPTNAAGWFDSTWQYRMPITVDNTKNTLPLKNYTLTLSLSYDKNFDFQKANASGYDFRFTEDDGTTLLDHDIEYFEYSKSARIKIRIPYAAAKSKFIIYFYYGAKISVANTSKDLVELANLEPENHLIIIDEGKSGTPSIWEIKGSAANAEIIQNSNIWSYDAPTMSGTYALVKDIQFSEGELDLEIMSEDDDGVGVIFGSRDKNNYYRLSWYKSATKVVTDMSGTKLGSGLFLQKKQEGKWTKLDHDTITYKENKWYDLKIFMDEEKIKVYIDNKKVMEVSDNSIRGSWVGLYSWANRGAHFRNIIDIEGYENPDLYLPVTYEFSNEENYSDFTSNLARTSPASITKIAENENINPALSYTTKDSTPLFAGLVTQGLGVKLNIDNQLAATVPPKEGEKSGVANWSFEPETAITSGEHTIFATPYDLKTGRHYEDSPKIKFIIDSHDPQSNARPMTPPVILDLGENSRVNMKQVYTTSQRRPLITGLSPYGWPVRIYIDGQSIGNATVQDGKISGTSNFYIKPTLSPGRHILIAVTYNPQTNVESKSPQVITFEVK